MRIQGTFPGGPTRTGSGRGLGGGPRLKTVEEAETARARQAVRRRVARRRSRRALGVAVVSAAALAAGGLMGWATRQSREELAESPDPQGSLDRMISAQVNRTLLELWKMESMESVRGPGAMP